MRVSPNDARGVNSSAQHSPTSNGTEPQLAPDPQVWEFLTALRDVATFREVRDSYPEFELSGVHSADPAARLLWDTLCFCDRQSVQNGEDLETAALKNLRAIADVNPTANEVIDWVCDPKARVYKSKDARAIATRLVQEFQHIAIAERPLTFSTDADLGARLGAVEWLWPRYIPRGFPTLIVGPQDGGKSTVAQDFCRTILLGGQWPDGSKCETTAEKLLWIDTEGSLALFQQRLEAWKMPRGRFIFPADPTQEINLENAEDWRWIEQVIETFRPPLIVIDALSGAHSTDENSNDGMKQLLKKLCALAQKYNIAVILIHHLNKGVAGVEEYPLKLDRIRGASTITQFCRSVLALTAPDKTAPDERRLDVIKLNLARKPEALGYTLTDDGPAWGTAPEPAQPRRAGQDAADWLRGALADGQRPAAEVRDEGIAAGFSDFALREARKILNLNVTKSRAGKNAGWNWELPPENGGDDQF